MAFIDPKAFLLKHVEKIVLVAAVAMLCWTVWSFPPWAPRNPLVDAVRSDMSQIAQRQKVQYVMDKDAAAKDPNKQMPPDISDVPDYVRKIQDMIRTPWASPDEVNPYPPSWVIFEDDNRGGVWKKNVPPPPIVEAPTEVLAKAEKNRVIVIFKIDQQKERRRVEDSNVPDYAKGLRFYRVVITRQNVSTGEPPVELNKDTPWLPANLPRFYGAPVDAGSRLDEPGVWGAGKDVVILSQRQATPPPMPGGRRTLMEEELRRQQEERSRLSGAPGAGAGSPTPGLAPPTPPARPKAGTSDKVVLSADETYYWFVDNVDTEGKYRYTVAIEARNPVYKSTSYQDSDKVPDIVTSPAAVSRNEVEIAPFKEWYFVGGAQAPEQAQCVVKVMTAQERKLDAAEVIKLVAEIRDGKAAAGGEPVGEWVKDRVTVKPGEEIGVQKSAKLSGGQMADVDFGTGEQVVLVSEGFQVVEGESSTLKQMPDGTFQKIKMITRTVLPKLSVTVMDRKGSVTRRWQETVKEP